MYYLELKIIRIGINLIKSKHKNKVLIKYTKLSHETEGIRIFNKYRK